MKEHIRNQHDACPRVLNLRPPVWAVVLLLLALPGLPARAASIQWGLTNGPSGNGNSGVWSAGADWAGGVAPGTGDSAVFYSTNSAFTNIVDSSTSIQDLSYLRGAYSGSSGQDDTYPVATVINPNQTLSVLGPNGFQISHAAAVKMNNTYRFDGQAMVVSNPAANFILNDGQSIGGSSSKTMTVDLQRLTNLTVVVNQFGAGDSRLAGGNIGDQSMKVNLAKTNLFTAYFTSDYTQLDFTNSIEIARADDNQSTSFAQNSWLQLGYSNVFYADSFGLARGNAAANSANMNLSSLTSGTAANAAGFQVSFTSQNDATPTSSVLFRNTNQVGRMSLLAIGVDSGTSVTNNRNNGILYLIGGKTDMLVDQIWLGRNRTNALGNSDMGGFAFDHGTVNANTVIAGYMEYTNFAYCGGFLLVGTNGTLNVNNNLILGYTQPVVTGFEGASAMTEGQMQINSGGTVCANQISVGPYGTNNAINVSGGGLLVVTNAIASPANSLCTLNLGGGSQVTFSVATGVTNAYVTNLVTSSTSPGLINIASVSGITAPSTNVLMVYQTTQGPTIPNLVIGSLPAGYNNMQIVADTVNNTVNLVINTNAPRNLAWRGSQNAQWDHSSANWVDLSLSAPTNTAIFKDNDKVQFDDTPGVATSIAIAETVVPGGILVTNSTNSFIFNNDGSGSVAGTLVKAGTSSLEMDASATMALNVSLNQGSLTGNGWLGSVNGAAGTVLNYSGTIGVGGVNCNGTALNYGTINGPVTVQSGAVFTNFANLDATFSVKSGAVSCYNAGTISYASGTSTIATNATFLNGGTLTVDVINVSGGGTFEDLGLSSSSTITSLNVAAAGKFIPGGDGIGTTSLGSSGVGAFPGAVLLSQGSTTVFKINLANAQTNSQVVCAHLSFGASATAQTQNGGTLLITNTGAAFSAGQYFQLFNNVYTPGSAPFNTGSSTNTYPVISPAIPGAGLAWDLSQLWVNGTLGVIPANTGPVLTGSFAKDATGANMVAQFSWSQSYNGETVPYRLETQVNPLSIGLSNNWTGVAGSWTNTTMTLTNTLGNNCVFYRLVFP
jgi:hypothetical protein